jgi:hypothetical protein
MSKHRDRTPLARGADACMVRAMKAPLIALALGSCVLALACNKKTDSTATAASASAGATAAASASAAPTAKAATADVKPADTAAKSAAASFPATALTAKDFTDYTIGLPPGGKVDKNGNNAQVETPDYRLILKVAKKNETADMKAMMPKMGGFKEFTVDQPDGLIAHVEDKSGTQYVFTRYIQVGDKLLSCESALTKPAKDKAKAQEAFDVCGTLKKK